MSGKIRLGKTKDSRTRGKQKLTETSENIKNQLKVVKEYLPFANYMLKRGYSITTTNRFIADTATFIKWAETENIPVESIEYTDILYYIQLKKKTIKQRSICCILNSIKHYYEFLGKTAQREDNPASRIKIKGVKRKILYNILSHQELESLYHNFTLTEEKQKNHNKSWFKQSVLVWHRNKIILGLMIYQGLNTNELSRLQIEDIKPREGKIYISAGRRSNDRELKLESHQVLDIMEYLSKTLPEILRQAKKSSNKLFASTGVSDSFNNIMAKFMKKLHNQNNKITSANQIRTSVITHWIKTHNLRMVQYMAGHRFVSSTEAYLINDIDGLLEDISKYHPI